MAISIHLPRVGQDLWLESSRGSNQSISIHLPRVGQDEPRG